MLCACACARRQHLTLPLPEQVCAEQLRAQEAREAEEVEQREVIVAPYRALADAICARGYRMTRPQFEGHRNEGEKVGVRG